MPSITPSLWFDHNLEEAAKFYTSVFPNSRIEEFNRATDAGPGEPGSVLSGTFVLDGTASLGSMVARSSHSARRCPSRSTGRTKTRSTTTGIG
jgi:predicted 3-demethylubiquinone-9 3-methyltransferase (glyoxalase superfamily)